ncbi:hypothetical protein HPB52_000002 [Rhipicephalus sanguineus]|uniref:Uncharacterized protein n=1 Tax=Rhipicephalus sanguineus TaxID=34632 RepID=A0A9D4QBE1_RHISA|nr:hypothetical protein HPB52_000002 [Rhipicephalus sanguineus]
MHEKRSDRGAPLRLANGGLLALKGRQNPSLMGEKASSATVVMSVATPRDHATRPNRRKGLFARRETGRNLTELIHNYGCSEGVILQELRSWREMPKLQRFLLCT